jgi:hypothetical protein
MPSFEVDPDWPNEPNDWVLDHLSGLHESQSGA